MVDLAPGTHTGHTTRIEYGDALHHHEEERNYGRPLDRVRWGPVVAGLFGTLSILTVLTVLGLAIGASTVDRDSSARAFGIGAGIWGILSALIAFAIGGWVAAGTSALRNRNNALIQGAVMWMVTVGLLAYFVAGGVGSMARTAVEGAAANPSISNPDTARGDNSAANDAGAALAESARNVTGSDVARAADRSAEGAWGTFAALVLALVASLTGSYLGARKDHDEDRYGMTDYGRTTTAPVSTTTSGRATT